MNAANHRRSQPRLMRIKRVANAISRFDLIQRLSRLEQRINFGKSTRSREKIHRQILRNIDAVACQQRRKIIAPRNCYGDVADGVFHQQIPADNPRHKFAKRSVGIRVRRSRDRNHGSEFGIAKRRKRAGNRREDKQKRDRRSAIKSRVANRRKNSRANHRRNAQRREINYAQRFVQPAAFTIAQTMRRIILNLLDRFCAKKR